MCMICRHVRTCLPEHPFASGDGCHGAGLPPGITAEFYHDWRFAVVCCDPCHSDVRRLKDLNAVIKYMRAHADCRWVWNECSQVMQ